MPPTDAKRPGVKASELVFRTINAGLALGGLGYAALHGIDWGLVCRAQGLMMGTWPGYLWSQRLGAAWFRISTLAALVAILINPMGALRWAGAHASPSSLVTSFGVASLVGRALGVGTKQAFVFRRAQARRPGAAPSFGSGSRR